MHRWLRLSGLVILVLPLFPVISSAAEADKVQQLEQRVQDLEKQLQEMRALIQGEREKTSVASPIGQPAQPTPSPESVQEKKPITQLVGPGGTLGIGGDIRFRPEGFDNLQDFNGRFDQTDQREAIRFRPRIYMDWKPNDLMEAYVRFTKEWVYGQDKEIPGYDVESKDVMFDNAWVDTKNILGSNFSLRVGRQDLVYGEGFVILDGTPNDGSQTGSFDAVKMTWTHDFGSLDLIYSKLQEYDAFASDDENLYGIYNKLNVYGVNVEPYVLYRSKNLNPDEAPNIANPTTRSMYDPSPAEDTLLLGLRGTKDLYVTDGVKLALAGEIGKEFGKVDFTGSGPQFSRMPGSEKVDRDAWGGTGNATLTLEDVVWKPALKAAFTYLSGDDPTTEDYEGWDDFYGEWPKYSELYVYSLYDGFKGRTGANDPDIGVWSNMYMPEASLTFTPIDKLTQTFRYLYFFADEENGPGGGDDRGHNLQTLTNYVFTPNLTGHFLFEYFIPGSYYLDDADEAYYTRLQLLYSF